MSKTGADQKTEKAIKIGRSGQSVSLRRWREINEVHREENPEDRGEGQVYWDAWSPPQTRGRSCIVESSQPSQQTQTPSIDQSPSSIFRIPKEQRPPRRIIKPGKSQSKLSRQKAMAELKNVAVIAIPGTRSRVRAQTVRQNKFPSNGGGPTAVAAVEKDTNPNVAENIFSDDFNDDGIDDLLVLASQQAEETDRRLNNNMPETPKLRTSGRRSLGRNLNKEIKPNVTEDVEVSEESVLMFETSTIEDESIEVVTEQKDSASPEVFDDADDEIFSQLNF